MQTIVVNMNGSDFNRFMEATALKAGYLLGDEVFAAGDTPLGIDFREQLADYSSIRKARFLKHHFKNDPAQAESFEKAEQSLKKSATMKLDSKLIAAKKKMEKSLGVLWEQMITETEKALDKMGFMALKPFVDENTFCYLHVSSSAMEGNQEGSIKASELLRLMTIPEDTPLDKIGTPELFLFGNEFLSEDYAKPAILNPADAGATDPQVVYLQHIITLPYLSELSTAELRAARESLQIPGTSFRLAVDEWCNLCYDGLESVERLSAFTGQVMPAAKELQQSINTDIILQKFLNQTAKPVEVWAGEMPVWQIWEYYRHFKTFGEETWQTLQDVKEDPEYKDQRWPVMMIKASGASPAIIQAEEEEIKPVRKYLQID